MFQSTIRVVPTLASNLVCSRGMVTLRNFRTGLQSTKATQKYFQTITTTSQMSTATVLKELPGKAKENLGKLIASGVLSELRPPTPMEIPRAIRDLARLFKSSNWKNLTVREAWLNTLVTTEVICWFFVGECIGKGTLIGYQV